MGVSPKPFGSPSGGLRPDADADRSGVTLVREAERGTRLMEDMDAIDISREGSPDGLSLGSATAGGSMTIDSSVVSGSAFFCFGGFFFV